MLNMDSIKLIREIEERRKRAKEEAEELIEILKTELFKRQEYAEHVLSVDYRIKEKSSILEKIEFFKLRYPEKSDLEILEEKIRDIIGITVETRSVEDYIIAFVGTVNAIQEVKGLKMPKQKDVLLHDGTNTGTKSSELWSNVNTKTNGLIFLSMYYRPENGIPYEIQIADRENIQRRNSTHDEFKVQKYKEVRQQTNNSREKEIPESSEEEK